MVPAYAASPPISAPSATVSVPPHGISGTPVACASCSAPHGAAHMRLGRRELTLRPENVVAVRRTAAGEVVVLCRRCGCPTRHRADDVRADDARPLAAPAA